MIKYIFPENIKKQLRKVENFFIKVKSAFNSPVIMTGSDGIRIIVEPQNHRPLRWFLEKSYNVKELVAIEKLSKIRNDIFFDIGANIGIITLSNANKYKKIFSFEPFPETFNKLEENVCINHFKNIKIEQLAFSNKEGEIDFYFDLNNSELNSLGNVFEDKNTLNKTAVKTSTVDSYCFTNRISHIDLLKIDTEGFELEVLSGALEMMKSNRISFIQFEISKTPLKRLGKKSIDIFNLLLSCGYKSYDYSERENKFIGPIHDSDTLYNNFYASKEDLTKLKK